MTNTSNKKVIVITAIILAVIIMGALILTEKKSENPEQDIAPLQEEKSLTYEPVLEDIEVPELNVVELDETIAIPEISIDAAPGVTDKKLRRFSISAKNDTYAPSEVIVNQGDTVHINFTAVDKTYDITFPDYNIKQTAQEGETKFLGFSAVNPGKFLFYCEICGGLDSDVNGHIIIVPKE